MNARRLLGFALLSISSIHGAFADSASPWYVGASVGSNAVSDFDLTRTTRVTGFTPGSRDVSADMKRETSYAVAIGYRFNESLALEGEYAHRSNDADKLRNEPSGTLVPNNWLNLRVDSLMANAVYSFSGLGSIRPMIGVGLGAANIDAKYRDSLSSASDSNWSFAYQALIGAEWSLTKNWSLTGQYQYFVAPSPGAEPRTHNAAGTSSNTYKFNDYTAQTVSLGLRYNF